MEKNKTDQGKKVRELKKERKLSYTYENVDGYSSGVNEAKKRQEQGKGQLEGQEKVNIERKKAYLT